MSASGPPALVDAAQDRDSFYRLLFENNPQPMWIYDRTTLRFLDVNQAALFKYGYSRDEFLRLTVSDIRPADDLPYFLDWLKSHETEGCAGIWRHRLKSGETIHVEIHRSFIRFAGIDAELVVANDVTSRIRAESCLSIRYALTRVLSEHPADPCRKLLQCLGEGLAFERAQLWLVDPDSDTLHLDGIWSRTPAAAADRPVTVAREQGLLGKVWTSGHTGCRSDIAAEPDLFESLPALAGMRSALAFPTRARDDVNGVVLLLTSRCYRPDDYIYELVSDIGSQLGGFIERRRTEEMLVRAEASFRDLFEDAPFAYHQIDREGRVVHVSRIECELLGVSAAGMIGRPIWDFVAPSQREESRAAVLQKLAGAEPLQPFLRRYSAPGGELRDFEIHEHLVRNDRGEVVGMRSAMLDVTISHRAQKTIAHQAALLNSVNDAIFAVDGNKRITEWNHAAEVLYGWTREEAIGQPLTTVLPTVIDTQARDLIHQEILVRGQWKGELAYYDRQGRQIVAESSCSLQYDRRGNPKAMVVIQRDVTERKRIEDQLRILSSAIEQSPVSILITDLAGTIQYANPKTCELTGYSQDELIGRTPAILKSGETSPAEYRNLWRTIEQGGTWHGLLHNRKKNGELFWEAATIRAIRNARDVPTHYLAVKEDITAQKEMQAALRASEERFRLAAESTADAIYEWDLRTDRVQLFGNREMWHEKTLDGRPTTARDFFKLIHADDRDRVATAIRRHLEAGEPFREEYRVMLPTGQVRYWSDAASAVRDDDGKPVKWIGVTKDVTELRAAERANAELAAIVESADVAIVSRDLSGKVLTWNPGAERVYGYPAGEMIGRNISLLIPPDRPDEEAEIDRMLRRGERIDHRDTVRLRKTGERIDMLLTISPIRDRYANVIGAAHIGWDITEHKHLRRQLSLAQKLESIGSLAAGIAHEINTPIQYVGDNARFLEDAFRDLARFVSPGLVQAWRDTPDTALRRILDPLEQDVDLDYLRAEIPLAIAQLQQGVDHVARIVRAMKEFSHPGAVEKTLLDVNRAIESTAVVSRNEWKYVAELTTDLDPDLPRVPCVGGEFNQVMLNLIVNAAHAVGDVMHQTGAKGAIRLSTRRSGAFAEIRIADTGTGIPEAIHSKIFDPFFTTKEVGKGTGQGLAIAHSVIVQKHGGRLTFETASGVGTTFIIQLPLAEEMKAS